MGYLISGRWVDEWYDTASTGGEFKRTTTQYRNWITKDGSKGMSGEAGFKAEKGRYHLYVSLACPWAHRTLIFRALKGLEEHISLSVVHWYMAESGWTFNAGDGVIQDPIFNADYLYQIYLKANQDYEGRVTVPLLWDKQRQTIVSNESAEIIRMFNSAFDDIGALDGDYYPSILQDAIDEINERIYHSVNNGVYKAGFATTQSAYEEAMTPLFNTLDWLEKRLSNARYLFGNRVTEADWRLFTTLIRFDPVYVSHFKCNKKMIKDYPNLWGYLRDLYQMPKIADTVNMKHIKGHYYQSHDMINPTRIVPLGPDLDYWQAHNRA